MAEIIINTKEVIKRKSYYPDFINIIRCVERNDNVNSIKLQFDNRETYINSALTIISCIRDAHKEIDIMGSCIVY